MVTSRAAPALLQRWCGARRRRARPPRALLDALPPPLAPLDLSALTVSWRAAAPAGAGSRWLRHHDLTTPHSKVSLETVHALVLRRHAELDQAIATRQWFDPWVFELEAERPGKPASPSEAVLPWVAGLAAALEQFPALLQMGRDELREPLAVLYAHFEAEDLEDADDLRSLIDEIAPPDDLAEAVQDLVRRTCCSPTSRLPCATVRRSSR
jgi:uncharacterized protein